MSLRAKKFIELIDLTSLNENDTKDTIEGLAAQANYPSGHVAALCVYPKWIQTAKAALGPHSPVLVATVVNFPHGNADVAAAVAETKSAVELGADEIDFVFPYRLDPVADKETLENFVSRLVEAAAGKRVKAILETGEMKDEAKIKSACHLCLRSRVDFLKTSTGKVPVGATVPAAKIMLEAIKESGRPSAAFKASGGIRTMEDAAVYAELAEKIMGDEWLTPSNFRFGASGLLSDLLKRTSKV